MNEEQLNILDGIIREGYSNTAGVVILQNGQTVCERYYNGQTAERALHVFSVTKSIVSMLIGMAVEQGMITGIDAPVLSFFPDYTPKRGEKTVQRVTLRDMLTMTVPYKYKSAPYTKYFTSEDWVKTALDLLGGKGQIGEFRYAPLIGPDILSGILSRATGRSAREFACENLFDPLGIRVPQDVVFHSKEEQLAIMTKAEDVRGWVADLQGVNTAGWGLFLTPMDMAKLGQLYLNRGVWNGRRLLSADWIDESTSEHSRCVQWGNLAYGYLWWLIDEREHSYAAMGDGGNVIYVNPAKELVVAVAARFKPRAADRIELIRNQIEPML
jgi:CubicO group peptidase (beta-lactamase class C family)